MEVKNCQECGASFEYEPLEIHGHSMFERTICDDCMEAQQVKLEAEEAARKIEERADYWRQICPPLYRETDLSRLSPKLVAPVNKWQFGPRGIGFVGPAGSGKTRTAFALMERIFMSGKEAMAMSATRFAKYAADQFDDGSTRHQAREKLRYARNVSLLLLDDIGKSKLTERAEVELYDLLEDRTSHLCPTIWTANASGDDLLSMLSKDRGEPILRRLAEFSEIVSV